MKDSSQPKRSSRTFAKLIETEFKEDIRNFTASGPAKVIPVKRAPKKARRPSKDALEQLDSILGLASFLREVEWSQSSPVKLTRAATHVAVAQYIAKQVCGLRSPSTTSSVS